MQGGPVLGGRNKGGFFMAIAADLEKVFGSEGRVVDLLAELKRQDWVLRAVDDQDGGGNFSQFGLRVEL